MFAGMPLYIDRLHFARFESWNGCWAPFHIFKSKQATKRSSTSNNIHIPMNADAPDAGIKYWPKRPPGSFRNLFLISYQAKCLQGTFKPGENHPKKYFFYWFGGLEWKFWRKKLNFASVWAIFRVRYCVTISLGSLGGYRSRFKRFPRSIYATFLFKDVFKLNISWNYV